ncbi:MAG: UDP-N-acetylmuramate:L-alanyl-gamma-D-glutamyl-meso-diaminopimelate ligase, partial [Acidobacteria bacterium]|nr:UDP-N-acetylmuramate:L-alanyl-gamma-D-glutamyl-meso-diaminopimelate ligase [Acidobacteriota bacterium]
TTTTSLAGWLLTHGGADPSVLIGGIAENFDSSYRLGGGRDFVIEGDEYDSAFFDKTAKFLKYLPDIAVVNNIEFDHADIYPDLDAIRLAFQRFVNLVPRRGLLLLGADNADALALRPRAHCRVETFGLADGADWQAHDLQVKGTSTTFGVRRDGTPAGTFELPLLGAYNVRNALAAIAIGAAVGLHTDTLIAGLRDFKGVRRRMQLRGTAAGVSVYDDFAHHPTAIAETLAGVRSAYPNRRIWAIFEPRSATSCRKVFESDFTRALSGADRVVLPAVFRSTLPEEQRLSAEQIISDLRAVGVDAQYIPQVDDIVKTVARDSHDGDLIVVMSNGGFENIHQKLLDALGARAH